jgi:hypothetical protein
MLGRLFFGAELRRYAPMRKKQAYAGLVPSEPMVVPRNTICMLFPPTPGASGIVQVNFRNGSDPLQVGVGYGEPFALLPADGQIVSTVSLVSGTVDYYYSSRDIAPGFLSQASSKGSTPIGLEIELNATGATTIFTATGIAYVLAIAVAATTASGSPIVSLVVDRQDGYSDETIYSHASPVNIVASTLPGATVALPGGGLILYDGDALVVEVGSGDVTTPTSFATVTGYQEPT